MHAFLRLHLIPRDATSSPACTATVNILFSLWGIKMFIYLFIVNTLNVAVTTPHTQACASECATVCELLTNSEEISSIHLIPQPISRSASCFDPPPLQGQLWVTHLFDFIPEITANHSTFSSFFLFVGTSRFQNHFFLSSFSITQLEYKSKHFL